MRRGWPLLLFLALGCAKPNDLLPMEVGRSWTYTVRAGFDTYIESVKVERTVPTAGTEGYELTGPLGVSRIAWRDGVLYAESASNAFFEPPLPLVALDKKPRKWSGWIEAMGKRQPAKGTLTHKDADLTLNGRTIRTLLAVVNLKTPKTTLDLRTWFEPGVGMIQQEQRTGDKLDVAIQLLSGP